MGSNGHKIVSASLEEQAAGRETIKSTESDRFLRLLEGDNSINSSEELEKIRKES